jgi:ABC-2 type transport system ATP-binding protein
MDAIVSDNLTKQFKPGWPWQTTVTALNGLSLSVPRGEIYGFLGPNGAGKTTTLKILLGLMRATSGTAEIMGKPAGDVQVRRRIGFLPESPYFYDYVTAEEFLTLHGHMAGLSRGDVARRVVDLLEMAGLLEAKTRQLRTFSKGMLQRVGLAQALIHDPELVILDEPMSGLDPVGRKQIRDLILSLRDRGKTVFFSTHIIPDVEVMCDRVGIVGRGRLLAAGRMDELVGHTATHSVEVVCEGISVEEEPLIKAVATRVLRQGGQALVALPDSSNLEEVLALIRGFGGRLVSVTPQKGSLEELFFRQVEAKTEARTRVEV